MFWIQRGDWYFALVLFVVGNVGVAGSIVFYESLLPHLVSEDQLDRVSSAGYAIGYLGGGTLLAINLLMIQKPSEVWSDAPPVVVLISNVVGAATAVVRWRASAHAVRGSAFQLSR